MKNHLVFFTFLFIWLARSLFAQDLQPYRLQAASVLNYGAAFDFWKAKNDQATELSIPILFVYPYSPKLRLYGLTAPAFSTLNTGEKYSLNGLSDLKLGGHYLMSGDRWLLTFGLNLPTGKNALKSDEYAVASVLTIPAFQFRVPSYGQGSDLQVGLSTGHEMDDWVLGFGVSYLKKGGFKPFADVDETYGPGDELSLTIGAERQALIFGKQMRITADLLYSNYSSDNWAGEEVFKSGNRLLLQVMSVFKHGPYDIVLLMRNRSKAKNKTGSGSVFETERKNSNGNQFEIIGTGYSPMKGKVRLKGILDFKFYSNSDYGTGGATLFGFGVGGRKNMSSRLDFDGDIRLYFGGLQTAVEKVSVFGVKVFGGFIYRM